MKRKQNRTSARRANAIANQLQALTEEMAGLRASMRSSNTADLLQREIIEWNKEKSRKAELTQRTPPPTRSAKKNPTGREKKIIEIISEDLALRGTAYCTQLDARKIPTPRAWQTKGCPVQYVPAYKIDKWRKRIQDEKYRLTRARRAN